MQKPSTNEIIVAFSAGKDSLVTLDICASRFKRVYAYFMYYVKGLSFNDAAIRWAENRYGIVIEQTPHWELAHIMRGRGSFMRAEYNVRATKVNDIEDLMRQRFNCEWIASGEMKCESLERRGMLGAMGTSSVGLGVASEKRHRYYPLADWSKASVFNYMKRQRIPLPPIYAYGGRSFGYFRGAEMKVLHDHFPADYAKVLAVFPNLEAVRVQYEEQCRREAGKPKTEQGAKVRRRASASVEDSRSTVQPASN